MLVWHIKSDPNFYGLVLVKPEENLDTFKTLKNPIPQMPTWVTLKAEYYVSEDQPVDENLELGQNDFGSIYLRFLTVNQKAKTVLEPETKGKVEFLPIQVDDEELYILHVLRVSPCLDLEQSSVARFKGTITGVKKPVFKADCLENETIFVLEEDRYSKIFVTEKLKEVIEAANLTGLRIRSS